MYIAKCIYKETLTAYINAQTRYATFTVSGEKVQFHWHTAKIKEFIQFRQISYIKFGFLMGFGYVGNH